MAKGIFGYLRFNINENNLSGDYMNWDTEGLQIEQGSKVSGNPGEFEGSYETTWKDTVDRKAHLIIAPFRDNTWELTWEVTNDPDHTVRFRGRGVIRQENVLSGFYEMLP